MVWEMNVSDMKFGQLRLHEEKPEKITTGDIVNYLEHKYNSLDNKGEWCGFGEVRTGTGFSKGSDQGIDFWAIHCWAGNARHAYEIKVSRSDFIKEIKNPKKRRRALLFSNYFNFIAPKGLLKIEEIPAECGLKEVYWANNQTEIDRFERYYEEDRRYHTEEELQRRLKKLPGLVWFLDCKTAIDPPLRESFPPSWTFVASLFRRMQEMERQRQIKLLERSDETFEKRKKALEYFGDNKTYENFDPDDWRRIADMVNIANEALRV